MTLSFPGGDHAPQVKTPETLLASARDWLDLADEDFEKAAVALQEGEKAKAMILLARVEHKSAQARQDIAEAIALELAGAAP